MIGIIVAFIMFMLLVVSHEFGHFIMAKLFKVRVNEFSVGMGPLIYEKTKGETQYSL
ncbi:MAG: site-2 protease family protein, partial [Firmicutes bacterium]|nr:site-2 protease family protein [Bacillota bacterium]